MVVLEGGGMLSSSGNQYLQPDYLSPLPTTLDAKKSPLALLAQTCSQIGADSPPSKPLMSPMEKSKKSDGVRSSPAKEKATPPQRSTPTEATKLAFKPYENNVVVVASSKKDDDRHQQAPQRPSSKHNEGRKSASPASSPEADQGKSSPAGDKSSSSESTRGASPIIRSGLEVLQGHPKDSPIGAYKPSGLTGGLNVHFGSLCCPPEHSNPAFRPPFPGASFPSPPMFSGYPGGPFLSYARVKTPSGGEALVPVCKDPYCTGCQFSPQNQQLLATGPCPSGCTQCDHQKYNLAMAMSLVPPGALSSTSSLAYQQLGRPYVCNWIAGDSYCGKRFVTSEELLQHLRSHTSGSEQASLAHHPLFSRPGYPNPPLSPLSAARYHPYGKAPTLPTSPYSAFNPTALGPYYSAYSMYGQRIGAAVHQ